MSTIENSIRSKSKSKADKCRPGQMGVDEDDIAAVLTFNMASLNGALHTGPWIWIQCGSGKRIQRHLCLHTALDKLHDVL